MRGCPLLHGLLLLACSCVTGYQPYAWHNPSGGYSDAQLSDNVFRVSFLGNGVTSYERASDFALLRASELALEHGYSYFVIEDSEMGVHTGYLMMPPGQSTAGSVPGRGRHLPVSYPAPWYRVICYEERPQTDAEVIDARVLRDSLRRKYELASEEPAPP